MRSERERSMEAAWTEVDRIDGTLRPDFVKVQDGFYDRRIVLDGKPVARFVAEGSTTPDGPLAHHFEPCHIPRYRTELVWRRVDPFAAPTAEETQE